MHMLPSYAHAAAAIKARKLLRRGFTTVRDAAGADRGHREAIASGLMVGPRMFVCGRGISQTGGMETCVPRSITLIRTMSTT